MAPNSNELLSNITEDHVQAKTKKCVYDEARPKNESTLLTGIRNVEKTMGFITPFKWKNIIFLSILHIVIPTWLVYNLCMGKLPKWQTALFLLILHIFGGFGVTGGAHRYWTHRSFQANEPLRWIMAIAFCMSGQNSLHAWVRDHRVHHKFSETSADPHDATRGFFFSHVGWLMTQKHPDVLREGNKVDLSDIQNDPIVQFQRKYFVELKLLIALVLPIMVPPILWGESWELSILYKLLFTFLLGLHSVWAVNSVAHIWGNRPYDLNINPTENWYVSFFAFGEGWHNYHHKFPWDYKAAELPYCLNITTMLLDAFAALGWAKNLKTASSNLVQAAKDKTSLNEE